jgi:TetR/AcrR family transcriptional repressor of nem operon
MGRNSNARQLLLNAASDLLWEKSYHSVTVDAICARAGVRKGSLYHFFDSKSAVAAAALGHFWDTVAQPAYEKYLSGSHPPLTRITCFLEWLERSQRDKHREVGKVLGWPFFTLGCELGISEPVIASKLCEVESAEVRYFELAIGDAIAKAVIEPCVARAEALALHAAMQGILARARMLNEPDVLGALRALPITVLRVKQTRIHEIEAGRTDMNSTWNRHATNHGNHNPEETAPQTLTRSNFARMRTSAPPHDNPEFVLNKL